MRVDQAKPILTIGILAYNKKPYLKVLLDQIIEQVNGFHLEKKVEVVVSDNASTDGTEGLMTKYMGKKLPYLRYNRNPKNLGFSGNILKQIELARGKYLWFMGDDELLDGGISKVLAILKRYNDGNNVFLMSIENIFDGKVWVSDVKDDIDFILTNGANMTTNIIPVAPARALCKEYTSLNKVWTHTQIILLVSLKLRHRWVLIHNDIFKYMTHFTKKDKIKSRTLKSLSNMTEYFDTILAVDKATRRKLFFRIKKNYFLIALIPFLDAYYPEDNREVRRKILEMRRKYGLVLTCTLSYLVLLVPGLLRRMLFDFGGYLFYGKKYAKYRREAKVK